MENSPLCGVEKDLCNMLHVALLFWRNLASSLQEWGFKINPYDWCMAKKTVHGKQMAVVWHVDDLKISRENGDTVDALMSTLDKQYVKEADLTIHRVKVHEYLGMKLDYCEQGKVKIDMTNYLKNPGRPARQVSRQIHHTGGKPSLQGQRDRAQVKQEGCPVVPHHYGKFSLPMQASAAGHPDRGGFPHDASDRDQ